MSDGLFASLELGTASLAGYRLDHVEVLNWGTFDRQVWRLTPGAETSLLTGDIGSGKSTLVDALTTLLMPAHKIAYNKAAGAESKERTLRSYVEGHYKSERIEASGRSRAIGLRAGSRSYSVILGVFSNAGYDETVTLAQVFQQRDQTGQPYRFYVTASKELSVAVDFADFGSDLRDLRKRLRASGAEVYDDFPKYSTAFRRLIGIRSEQALELFHQTVSMKSVGNLNDFVRDHMLEPSDASDRVREIIAHFEDLTKAHDAVTRAREQLAALEPIVLTAGKYDEALGERARLEHERDAVRLFVAELRLRLLADEVASIASRAAVLIDEQDATRRLHRELAGERESLIAERERAGGDRIGELERVAREARALADERAARRDRFVAALADAGLEPVADAAGFAAMSAHLATERPRLAGLKRSLDAQLAELLGRRKEISNRADELRQPRAAHEQPPDRAGRAPRPALRRPRSHGGRPALRGRAARCRGGARPVAWRGRARAARVRAVAPGAPGALRRRDRVGQRTSAHRHRPEGPGGRRQARPREGRLAPRPTPAPARRRPDPGRLPGGQARPLPRLPARRARQARGPPVCRDARGVPRRAARRHPRGPGPRGRAPREGRPTPGRRPPALGARLGQRTQDQRAARGARRARGGSRQRRDDARRTHRGARGPSARSGRDGTTRGRPGLDGRRCRGGRRPGRAGGRRAGATGVRVVAAGGDHPRTRTQRRPPRRGGGGHRVPDRPARATAGRHRTSRPGEGSRRRPPRAPCH